MHPITMTAATRAFNLVMYLLLYVVISRKMGSPLRILKCQLDELKDQEYDDIQLDTVNPEHQPSHPPTVEIYKRNQNMKNRCRNTVTMCQ